tara:strand:+ start:270 stop:494 length:225 start_codon:yes stop_codon:yes gene_type:complete
MKKLTAMTGKTEMPWSRSRNHIINQGYQNFHHIHHGFLGFGADWSAPGGDAAACNGLETAVSEGPGGLLTGSGR